MKIFQLYAFTHFCLKTKVYKQGSTRKPNELETVANNSSHMAFSQRACVSHNQLCADIKTLQLQYTFSSIFLSGLIQLLVPHAKSKTIDFCVVLKFIFLGPLMKQ